jgi:hypothetical protein
VAFVCVATSANHPLLYRHCHRISSVSSHSLLPAVETVRLRLALSRLRRADCVCRCYYCSACTRFTLPLRVLLLLLQLPLLLCSALLLLLLSVPPPTAQRGAVLGLCAHRYHCEHSPPLP